ncbi:hypothetical protein NDU88_002133 [Pleurodeles waltl]|uniref:Uncharacterized protein n=1 Tax=Pleurodeles waltl TaxID=8319 RepID=A0AAV7NL58_PLEWA|nr:hypothetical protein NDU88_002133 [Pleurodeles waltl]
MVAVVDALELAPAPAPTSSCVILPIRPRMTCDTGTHINNWPSRYLAEPLLPETIGSCYAGGRSALRHSMSPVAEVVEREPAACDLPLPADEHCKCSANR